MTDKNFPTPRDFTSLGDLLAEYAQPKPAPLKPSTAMYDLHAIENKVRLIKLLRVHYFGISLRSANAKSSRPISRELFAERTTRRPATPDSCNSGVSSCS